MFNRMKLISPHLDINEDATGRLIESVIGSLNNSCDAYVILEIDKMNYIQALNTENGFVVSFQKGSLNEHFEFNTYQSRPKAIVLFQEYFSQKDNWQGGSEYRKKRIGGFWYRFGLNLGRFFGSYLRGYRDAKRK